MSTAKSTKFSLHHPQEPDCQIVGILEQLEPDAPTQGRRLALILHGTMGHKDYLFQRRLAQRLPIDSFRFDFRGNHESGGTWRQGALAEDLDDLNLVVQWLKETFGYFIDLVVGHSRGSIVAMRWLCTSEDGRKCGAFVNASGRYRMEKLKVQHEIHKEDFATKGYHEWKVTVARKPVVARIHPHDIDEFISWDTSLVWDKFPHQTDALTIHGLADKTVPPYDATIYARALGARHPGTHTLYMMEDADHNFTNHRDEVVDAILEWWESHEVKTLRTGVWRTGIRGKL